MSVLADQARDPARRAVVSARLADAGFESAGLRRVWTSAACWGGTEYAWRAGAGDGRACIRDGEHVTARVDRDRTSKDPFSRPAR